ncbi:hypothetical protein K438DRAFT_1447995, partial [Mycena galopus ATCC 62051]
TSTSSSSCSSPSNTTFIHSGPPESPLSEPDATQPAESGKIGCAQYPCLHPTCDRVLTSLHTRETHMRTHNAKVPKVLLCTLGCSKTFTREHDRQRHEVTLHGKKHNHICTRCKRFFSNTKRLNRHVCRGRRQGWIQ